MLILLWVCRCHTLLHSYHHNSLLLSFSSLYTFTLGYSVTACSQISELQGANPLIYLTCPAKSRKIPKMQGSALLGSPPANPKDILIRIGLKASSGSQFNPNPLHPYGPPKPSPDLSGESDAYKIVVTEIICLILILSVTLGRFWARAKQESWSFGVDDLMAIPACLCGTGYMGSIIAYTGSCYGKHIWFCTYEQIETIQVVRFSRPLPIPLLYRY